MTKSNNATIFETLGRNPIHPFPARMAAGIALDAIEANKHPLRVLDPMVGSGTVLAVAQAKGHIGYGIDIDPLAVLLANVWTRSLDSEAVIEKASEVLFRAKKVFKSLTSGNAYPQEDDQETRSFTRYWFDDYARRQLAALSLAIKRVKDTAVRDALWCAFSRLIITKQAGASLAMDLSHSRPHRTFERAPVKPFNKFIAAVETVILNCPRDMESRVRLPTDIKLGDARHLTLPDESIDLVLTSPPYLNAIDYLRCSKFSLVWMGYSISQLRNIRASIVGAEASSDEACDDLVVKDVIRDLKLSPKLCNRNYGMLARYALDMKKSLAEVSRVLQRGGTAVYVIGDSTVRGTFVRNSAIVRKVAENSGLILKSKHARTLPANRRYLPPPKTLLSEASLDARMRKEVVLKFEKPNQVR